MQLTKLNLLIIALIVGALGYGAGRYATPEKLVEVEKIVEKEAKETSKTTRKTKLPDGTVIEEEILVDKSTKESEREHSVAIESKKPDWFLAGGYGLNKTAYSLEVNRRILAPVFIGVQAIYYKKEKITALVKVGYEF